MVVVGPALAAVVGLGAVGGILANIALTPLTAGASVLQSYWYGAGLILGERMMYTVHWEKIKERLDKGEEFISVLDPIMNDDITAIANLSFKAMEQTGDLYLKAASSSIGAFIEKLLLAMLTANPTGIFGGGETEPPPEGETTPEGISLTIEEIKAMSDNTLLFETQPNIITKYTEATQAHMLTEKLSRNITEEIIQQEEIDFAAMLADLRGSEQIFQQDLFDNWTNRSIEDFYAQYITKYPSEMQDIIMSNLSRAGIKLIFLTRRKTESSDATLAILVESLLVKRQQITDGTSNQSPERVMQEVYAKHITIFLWNKIYI